MLAQNNKIPLLKQEFLAACQVKLNHFVEKKTPQGIFLSKNSDRLIRKDRRIAISKTLESLLKITSNQGEFFFQMQDGELYCPTLHKIAEEVGLTKQRIGRAYRNLKTKKMLITKSRKIKNINNNSLKNSAELKSPTTQLLAMFGLLEPLKHFLTKLKSVKEKASRWFKKNVDKICGQQLKKNTESAYALEIAQGPRGIKAFLNAGAPKVDRDGGFKRSLLKAQTQEEFNHEKLQEAHERLGAKAKEKGISGVSLLRLALGRNTS